MDITAAAAGFTLRVRVTRRNGRGQGRGKRKKERRGVRGGGREKQLRKSENKNKTKKGQKSQTKSGRSRENAGTKFAFFKRYPDVEPTTGTMRHKGRVQTEGDLSSLSLTSSVGLFIT